MSSRYHTTAVYTYYYICQLLATVIAICEPSIANLDGRKGQSNGISSKKVASPGAATDAVTLVFPPKK